MHFKCMKYRKEFDVNTYSLRSKLPCWEPPSHSRIQIAKRAFILSFQDAVILVADIAYMISLHFSRSTVFITSTLASKIKHFKSK